MITDDDPDGTLGAREDPATPAREPGATAQSPAPPGGGWRDYARAPLRPVAARGGTTSAGSRDPTERK